MENLFPGFGVYNTEGWGDDTETQLQSFLEKLTRVPPTIETNPEIPLGSESSPETFLDTSSDLAVNSNLHDGSRNASPESGSPLFEQNNFPLLDQASISSEEEKNQLQNELLARMEWSNQVCDTKPQSKR
jgi:hypothetical protein